MILFIYGTGGAGVEVCDLVKRNNSIGNRYSKIIFIDDFKDEEEYYGTRTIHFVSCKEYMENEKAEFIIAAGEPKVRELLFNKVKLEGYSFATLIDETAIIAETAQIAEGCIINAHAIVSSEVIIKENCMVMFQTIIGHHAVIESNCVICPKATVGGHSKVGELSFLGLASSMMQRVNIGKNTIVGMGSMVFKDVDDGVTVVGNPARVTKGDSGHRVFAKEKGDR